MSKSWKDDGDKTGQKSSADEPVYDGKAVEFEELVIELPHDDPPSMDESGKSGHQASNRAVLAPTRLLDQVPNERRLDISFEGITCRAVSEDKVVLSGAVGAVRAGEILAVMGASGSGKTTLLAAVGGRTPAGVEFKGTLLHNGSKPRRCLKGLIGFVYQDDQLYATLSVYETLMYAAKLRLPTSHTKEQRDAQVEKIISSLGLSHCRDTLIGDVSIRGISGGERKRVSIAQELLACPSAILLDEPTSGLDSTTSLRLVRSLRELASGGRSIMMTIHQPSHRVYRQLDKLMLLSRGETVYYGKASEALNWMALHGVHNRCGLSTSDFMLDVATGTGMDDEDDGDECVGGEMTRRRLIEAFRAECVGPTGWAGSPCQPIRNNLPVVDEKASPEIENEGPRWEAGWLAQCLILLSRTLRVRRSEAFGLHAAVQSVVPAILLGLVWWQVAKRDIASASLEVAGLLFFMLAFPFHINNIRACFTFPPDMAMVRKERASGMYRLSAYYVAKIIADIPVDLLWPTIYFAILYLMTGLRLTPGGTVVASWATLMLAVLTAQGMGQFFGAALPSVKHAHAITSVVEVVMLLTAGYFVKSMPVWVSWLRYTSIMYYAYTILLHLQYSHAEGTAGDVSVIEAVGSIKYSDQNQEVSLILKDPQETVFMEIGVLFLFMLTFRVLTYCVLRARTRPLSKSCMQP